MSTTPAQVQAHPAAARSAPNGFTQVETAAQSGKRTRSTLAEVGIWLAAIVLAFGVPLTLVVGAIFVSSWGSPLPIEVRVP